jgi:prepilin-type N-terminal cleavage/methylation domain-containing protein
MMRKQKGFSIFEILIVVTLFVLIAVVANQAFFTSLKGQNKSEANTNTKQNANYIVSVMERSLHSATQVTACTTSSINYTDADGISRSFSCSGGSFLSNGSTLTTSSVSVGSCNFSCIDEGGSKTVVVDMVVTQVGTSLRVDQSSSAQIKTRIRLRN